MAAFAHSVLFMMLALTSVIALHSTSRKRARAESVAEDKIDTMEIEPSTHSGVDDAQWHQPNNLLDAKLEQLIEKMDARMTKLSQEVKDEVAKLNDGVAKLERRVLLSERVEAGDGACSAQNSQLELSIRINKSSIDGFYYFRWIQKGQSNIFLAWEADFGRMYITISDNKYEGSSSGPVVETQEAFSDVLPFPNLFNKLKKAFDPEMTRQKCIDLIMDIEFDRPVVTPVGNGAGVTPPSEGWVNSFVRDNMAKFLKIVRKRGGKVEEY